MTTLELPDTLFTRNADGTRVTDISAIATAGYDVDKLPCKIEVRGSGFAIAYTDGPQEMRDDGDDDAIGWWYVSADGQKLLIANT